MRDEFFGDDRDLFKWSLVLDLAGAYRRILYVPMRRPDDLLDDSAEELIRKDVREFFRTDQMKRITQLCPGRMDVTGWDTYENRWRKHYFDSVYAAIGRREPAVRHVVFLDPDTGMECGSPDSRHLRSEQLATVWQCLRPDDILVLYQHKPQGSTQGWTAAKKQQFANALGIPPDCVLLRPALDICFYWAIKA